MSLLGGWEGRPVDEWRLEWGVPRLEIHDVVGSTNDVARALAEQGAPGGTTVLAEHQTRGRGQRGSQWQAPPARGLLLSVVLRPPIGHREPGMGAVPARVGLVVAREIERVAGVRTGLKWPNDLLANGHKLGGILCEGSLTGESFALVVGVGINVGQEKAELPPGLDPPATSLALLGATRERGLLAGALVGAVARLGAQAALPLSAAELREFARRDILRDCAITLDGEPFGIARGLSSDGALRVERAGALVELRGGTVRPEGTGASAAARRDAAAGSPDTVP